MELLEAWADAEEIGLELFETVSATALATPVDLQPPLTVVRCITSSNDWITTRPRLQVQTYGGTHAQARDMAEQGRQLVLASPNTVVAGASIDYASVEQAPVYVDYGHPDIHRYIATYRFEYRRPR